MLKLTRIALPLLTLGLFACGGGGGGNGGALSTDPTDYHAGTFKASSTLENQCASPRTGNDPNGHPWPDVQGSAQAEKMWLRSWTHELYLWYSEVPDLDPVTYTVPDYFDVLKTTATTASGHPKDKFHFTYPTDQWIALSQSGVTAGYGLQFSVISSTPPRNIVVAYVDPGASSPADAAGIARGWKVLTVDGVDIDDGTQSGVDTLNAGLSPAAVGEQHSFSFRDLAGNTHSVSMTTANVTSTPVQHVQTISTVSGPVGYMLFNDHIATAESELVDAIQTLKNDGIQDLILDIRYNGGGYLAIASELAYMIAGPASNGKTFELTQFNDQHPTTDPVTGKTIEPVPFLNTSQDFSVPSGQSLPSLSLTRVFVLTGPDTCSASEAIINSLRGINVQVIQIGSTTCGKPYGFYPADNCGTTYFSIQFRGVNDQGFGDYPDGFTPANSTTAASVSLPGCSVADDFTHALGDENEGRLAQALNYRLTSSCSVPASGVTRPQIQSVRAADLSAVDGRIRKSPWHENRILRPVR